MPVKSISATCQKFEGLCYWLCGPYFQRHGVRLHRVVWQAANGSIPRGKHIHHINGNRANNNLENLAIFDASEHLRHHGKQKPPQVTARWLKAMRAGAAKWHGSKEGRKWHSEHAKEYMRKLVANKIEKNCQQCGKIFLAVKMYAHRSKFCHSNCKAKALRRRRADRS